MADHHHKYLASFHTFRITIGRGILLERKVSSTLSIAPKRFSLAYQRDKRARAQVFEYFP